MVQHEPEDRVEQTEGVVELEDRDQRHLQRHDQQRDHHDEEPVAPWELEPGKGVPRQSAAMTIGRIVPPIVIRSVVTSASGMSLSFQRVL